MNDKDLQGREYARFSALKEGDVLEVDGGFTCIPANARRVVKEDRAGFYVTCKNGKHHLDNDEGDYMVGWYCAR